MLMITSDEIGCRAPDLEQGLSQAPACLRFAAVRPKQLDDPITCDVFVRMGREICKDRLGLPSQWSGRCAVRVSKDEAARALDTPRPGDRSQFNCVAQRLSFPLLSDFGSHALTGGSARYLL
jgi:hypothetical protein